MSQRRIVHLIVRGRVQGVGFRAFVAGEARALHIDGWVRNLRDGTVEAAGAGAEGAVASWIEALRRGPPASHVDRIEVAEADARVLEGSAGFSQFPTI